MHEIIQAIIVLIIFVFINGMLIKLYLRDILKELRAVIHELMEIKSNTRK